MHNKNNIFDFSEYVPAITGIIKEAVFWVCVLMASSKTMELISLFAPKEFLGFVGMEGIFGFMGGVVIEFLFVAGKYTLQYADLSNKNNTMLWMALTAITWMASFGAQGFDTYLTVGMILNGSEASQIAEISPDLALAMQFLIPGLPVFVMGVMALAAVLENNSVSGFAHNFNQQPRREQGKQRLQFTNMEMRQVHAKTVGSEVGLNRPDPTRPREGNSD